MLRRIFVWRNTAAVSSRAENGCRSNAQWLHWGRHVDEPAIAKLSNGAASARAHSRRALWVPINAKSKGRSAKGSVPATVICRAALGKLLQFR